MSVEVGQVYRDRDYRNSAEVWGPWITHEDGSQTANLERIQMREVEVVSISGDRVKVVQLKGKRPGAETEMKASALLGQSRSHGFYLVEKTP